MSKQDGALGLIDYGSRCCLVCQMGCPWSFLVMNHGSDASNLEAFMVHIIGLQGSFQLCDDMVAILTNIKITSSPYLKRIYEAWKKVVSCLSWQALQYKRGYDLASTEYSSLSSLSYREALT